MGAPHDERVQLADAGTTMNDIVRSVQSVTDMIGEITAASSEQSSGISQVNQAVTHLDQMTQQNAALVEESTAAAASMRDQAQKLAEVVAMFNVGAVAAPPPAAARAPVPRPMTKAPATAPRAVGSPTAAKPPPSAARLSSSTPPAAKKPSPSSSSSSAAAASSAPAAAPRAQAKGGDDDWESF